MRVRRGVAFRSSNIYANTRTTPSQLGSELAPGVISESEGASESEADMAKKRSTGGNAK